MIDGSFALAFSAGMVAAFNPCGFAMLPAYLAYFLGMEDESADSATAVSRGLKVSAVLTLGFVLVFALAGMLISWVSGAFQEHLPWATMVIGVALVGLGIAFLVGKEITVGLPKLGKGAGSRQLGSMFVFGISYAIASLSCTIGAFLVPVSGTFRDETFVSGIAVFVAYALGMGLVIGVLTIGVSLAKKGLAGRMRAALPYIYRISGGLLVLAGLYMTWYGYWDYQVVSRGNTDVPAGPVDRVSELSSDVSNWVNEVGATTLGLVLGAVVVVAAVLAWGWRAMNKPLRQG